MPSPHALRITLSERQQYLLEQITRRKTNPHRLVQRAQLVLFAVQGMNNTEISQQLQLHRHQVRFWRQRWQASVERLQALEAEGIPHQALSQQINGVLSDEPRSGGPAKFQVEQIVQIVAVACELPACSGRPITHWTPTELADEVVKRDIVEAISPRSVGRFLMRGNPAAPSESLLAQHSSGGLSAIQAAGERSVSFAPASSCLSCSRSAPGQY